MSWLTQFNIVLEHAEVRPEFESAAIYQKQFHVLDLGEKNWAYIEEACSRSKIIQ